MPTHLRTVLVLIAGACGVCGADNPKYFDVVANGATGNGTTLDTAAINKAIEAANAAGGGTVYFPAGTYLSGSIRLKSNVTLFLEQGSTILATNDPAAYDEPEPNQWDKLQDYGHSHFHNSLIWGENLENVAILGTGRIWGKGLVRSQRAPEPGKKQVGNKSIVLKNAAMW